MPLIFNMKFIKFLNAKKLMHAPSNCALQSKRIYQAPALRHFCLDTKEHKKTWQMPDWSAKIMAEVVGVSAKGLTNIRGLTTLVVIVDDATRL